MFGPEAYMAHSGERQPKNSYGKIIFGSKFGLSKRGVGSKV